jgi:hypothetical protein
MQKFLLPYLLLLGIVIGCGGEEFSTGQGAGSAGSPAAGAAGAGPGGATGAGGEGAAGQAGGGSGGSPPAGGASGSGGASAGASGASGGSGGSGAEGGTAGVGGVEGGAAGSEGGTAGAAGAAAGGTAGDAGSGQAGAAGNAGQDGGGQGGEAGAGQAGAGQAGAGQGGAGQAGSSGQAGSAGAGGAAECEGDLGGCFDGNQPRLCIDGKWLDAGGICNFGCSTGKCACSAPDRFSYFTGGFPLPEPTEHISDKKLGKLWLVRDSNADFDMGKLVCATNNNMRLPTLTEAKSLVAQQPDAIQCGATKNLDKTFVESFKEYVSPGISLDTPIWTSDLDPQGMTFVVQLTSGVVSTRDPAQKLPVIVLCIEKVGSP